MIEDSAIPVKAKVAPLTKEELAKLDYEMKPTWCDSGMTVADFCSNEKYWRLRATIDALEARNAELLAACKAALPLIPFAAAPAHNSDAIDGLILAIAQAEGKAVPS